MDVVSSVTTFSHILNIKDKLFPRKKVSVSTIKENLGSENSGNDNYCSLYLEHSYDHRDIGSNEKEKIELVIAKKSKFTIPIRHIDWFFMDGMLDPVTSLNCDIPELLLVGNEGCLLNLELKEVLKTHIKYFGLKGKKLRKSLGSMAIQCTYADGYKQIINAPKSLKESVYELSSFA